MSSAGEGAESSSPPSPSGNHNHGVVAKNIKRRQRLDPEGEVAIIDWYVPADRPRRVSAIPTSCTMVSPIKMEDPVDHHGDKYSSRSRDFYGMDPSTGKTCVLLRSRPSVFQDQDIWWMVDLSFKGRGGRGKRGGRGAGPRGKKKNQGATPLVLSCMHKYGWSESHARRVLDGYRQFMTLIETKSEERAAAVTAAEGEEPHEIEVGEDDDDDDDDDLTNTFYPCSKDVDLMWQEHILDTTNYIHDCLFLCGRFVGRSRPPYVTAMAGEKGGTAATAVDTKKRDDNTRKELKAMFGTEYDEELWTNQVQKRGVVESHSDGEKHPHNNSDDDSVMIIDPPEKIPIEITVTNNKKRSHHKKRKGRTDRISVEAPRHDGKLPSSKKPKPNDSVMRTTTDQPEDAPKKNGSVTNNNNSSENQERGPSNERNGPTDPNAGETPSHDGTLPSSTEPQPNHSSVGNTDQQENASTNHERMAEQNIQNEQQGESNSNSSSVQPDETTSGPAPPPPPVIAPLLGGDPPTTPSKPSKIFLVVNDFTNRDAVDDPEVYRYEVSKRKPLGKVLNHFAIQFKNLSSPASLVFKIFGDRTVTATDTPLSLGLLAHMNEMNVYPNTASDGLRDR